MNISLIVSSFIAGILTFLAPCTLPLVPAYLGFISGSSLEDLENPVVAKKARGKIFLNGFFFMLGFSAVFIVMGTLVGFIGAALLAPYRRWLGRIGGVFVIIFGLFMLNVLNIPFLTREKQI
ncbi:cytochrome c biogenesis protein CcdA, partial [Patescibacteria group bacterium]|nr:cytochrome c biogenesis protein CcdA [Patescibacteria group bacterium]